MSLLCHLCVCVCFFCAFLFQARLKELGMEWVIIRPGGLKTEKGTGTGVLTESTQVPSLVPFLCALPLCPLPCFP